MHSAVIRIRRTMGRDQAAAMLSIFAERAQREAWAGRAGEEQRYRNRKSKEGERE